MKEINVEFNIDEFDHMSRQDADYQILTSLRNAGIPVIGALRMVGVKNGVLQVKKESKGNVIKYKWLGVS
jgi:hypothetical protein